MKVIITKFAASALAMAAAALSCTAHAQAGYPTKPVTLILTYPAGGISDLLGRSLAQGLSKAWGQPVIVENKPGANEVIAASYVAKAAPDGYTLLLSDDGVFTLNPALFTKLPYSAKDFVPIVGLADLKNVLSMSKAVPANSLQEMLTYARQNPGKLNFASLGTGNIQHLLLETIKREAKVDIVHIPYKGYPDAINDVLSNQAQLVSGGIGGPALGHLRSGALKPLAVSGTTRSPLLPNVPTFAEAGLPNVQILVQFILTGPAGMPRDIIDKINRAASKVVKEEIAATVLVPNGMEAVGSDPADLARSLEAGRVYYAPLVKEVGVRLD